MTDILIVVLGIMTGIYFAFSCFMMKALNHLSPLDAISAMNSINQVILSSLFMPLFFGSTLWLFGALIWNLLYWQPNESWLWLTSASLYLLGMFAVTVLGNVPLNERLKQLPIDANHEAHWHQYSAKWRTLNHIRSLSSGLSCYILTFV